MGYDKKTWARRIAERTDLSSQIVHLTREEQTGEKKKSTQILFEIIKQQTISPSKPSQAFICGDTAAVCFQDAPLVGICQNVFYEQKYREINTESKLRYRATGLAFEKDYAYSKGARPVIYDRKDDAKKYLPPAQWWRIVNFDLSDEDNIIDWTHEREWRMPAPFVFERKKATLLFVNESTYRAFGRMCREENVSYMDEVRGVVVMSNLLY